MIRIIFVKELKEIFRTSKIVWLLAGVLVLLALSLYNGYSYYVSHSKLLNESQQVTYQQFISQGDKNPHLGAHFGFYAYKPTADLAMIDNGIEDYTGNSFYLEPHKRGIVRFRGVADSTGLRSFGFFNIGYSAEFILPLFIFLICHNIFSKEWENGTIKMVLSSRVTKRQLFAGKLLACFALVVGILLVLGISGVLLLLNTGANVTEGSALAAYFSFLAGLFVFAFMMTVTGVSVSVLARNSSLSLVVLSGFWLMGVFLVPRLSGELSRHLYPSMTSLDFENTTFNEKQYGVNGEGTKDERREKLKDTVLSQYHVKRLEDLPVFFIPITIEYFEETDGKVMDRAYAAIENNDNKQNSMVLASSVLSPFMAFRDFSMRISASDIGIHNDFAEKAETHRRMIGEIVNNFYQSNTVATNNFWKTIPQFKYAAPGVCWRLAGAVVSIATLAGWTLASILLMVLAYRRMHV